MTNIISGNSAGYDNSLQAYQHIANMILQVYDEIAETQRDKVTYPYFNITESDMKPLDDMFEFIDNKTKELKTI